MQKNLAMDLARASIDSRGAFANTLKQADGLHQPWADKHQRKHKGFANSEAFSIGFPLRMAKQHA